jgi:Rrf2 family protein
VIGLTQTTSYAIQALTCLSDPICSRSPIAQISKCSKVPKPYLAKILRTLTEAGMVHAKRGHNGGIRLVHPPGEINLLAICEAIEGPDFIAECLLGATFCAIGCECPTQAFWQDTRLRIRQELRRITLADILASRTSREESESLPPDRSSMLGLPLNAVTEKE